MSTIPSTMSAAGQCGLDYNIAITANNEKVVAEIELNQASSQAANKMNLEGSQAQEASILSQASQKRTEAIGLLTSTIGGSVAGFGLMGIESNFANKAQLASRTNDMEVEMKDISPAPRPVSPGTGSGVSASAATVEGSNPTAPETISKPSTTAGTNSSSANKEPVKTKLQMEYENKANKIGQISQLLPRSIEGLAQSTGNMVSASEKKNEAEASAMAIVAQGLTSLLSKNADAATSAQTSAETNKEALIKALEAMILANRVA